MGRTGASVGAAVKVTRQFGNKLDRPATDPLLEENGFWWELRSGDICHPIGEGKWFEPPYFASVWRAFCRLPILPFFSWKLGTWGGYAGFKIYGADADAYKWWMPAGDVYPGSLAMHISIRPFATINDRQNVGE